MVKKDNAVAVRYKKIYQKIVDEPRKPFGEILKEEGYSESVQKAPSLITNSKTWQNLLAEYLPDEELALVHRKGLHAQRQISRADGSVDEVDDHPTQHKFLDLAYKVKGKMQGDTVNMQVIVPIQIVSQTDAT